MTSVVPRVFEDDTVKHHRVRVLAASHPAGYVVKAVASVSSPFNYVNELWTQVCR